MRLIAFLNLKIWSLPSFFVPRYGGIYERGSREYTLDDFHSLQLDKMEKYLRLKESDVIIPDGDVESSSDDEDEDEDDDSDDDSDEEDEDEDEDEDKKDEDNPDIEYGEAGEQKNTGENAVEIKEEDQPTENIEKAKIDEESKLSQVTIFSPIYSNGYNYLLSRMSFALKQQLSWVYQKMPHVHQRIFRVLPYREKR